MKELALPLLPLKIQLSQSESAATLCLSLPFRKSIKERERETELGPLTYEKRRHESRSSKRSDHQGRNEDETKVGS